MTFWTDHVYYFLLQDLIDKARTTLVGNRSLVQRMQASMGIPVASDSDDTSYANFNQVTFLCSNMFVYIINQSP